MYLLSVSCFEPIFIFVDLNYGLAALMDGIRVRQHGGKSPDE